MRAFTHVCKARSGSSLRSLPRYCCCNVRWPVPASKPIPVIRFLAVGGRVPFFMQREDQRPKPTRKQSTNHKHETTYLNNSAGLVISPPVSSTCLRPVKEQIPPLPWQQKCDKPWSFQLANKIRVRFRYGGAKRTHINITRAKASQQATKQRSKP